MAVAASRGQGRRDDADPGQSRKDQGQALRRRSRPGRNDRQTAAAIAGPDRAFDEPAVAGAPARYFDPCAGDGTRPDRQSAGAAAQPPQGGFRAVIDRALARSFRGDAKHRTAMCYCTPENLEIPQCAIAHLRSGACAPSRNDGPNKKSPGKPGLFAYLGWKGSILLEEARKLLLEPRHAAAAVQDLLRAAGPGRVRLGVDVEVQLVAFLAPGGTGLVLRTIRHYDRNRMIIRVNFGFHGISFGAPAPVAKCLGYGIWAAL